MEKPVLLTQLKNLKFNFMLTLGAIYFFHRKDVYPILAEGQVSFGGFDFDMAQLSEMLSDKEDREIATAEFRKSGLRSLQRESFEAIRNYCVQTNQDEALRTQDWYDFARIIYESAPRNFQLELSGEDRERCPIEWKGRQITEDMDGQPLSEELFGAEEAFGLFQEIQSFAQSDLD